jgi:hypothetical protein
MAPSNAPIATESFRTSQVYPRRHTDGHSKIFFLERPVEDLFGSVQRAVIDDCIWAILHCTPPRSSQRRSICYHRDVHVAVLANQRRFQQLVGIGWIPHDPVLLLEVPFLHAPAKGAIDPTPTTCVSGIRFPFIRTHRIPMDRTEWLKIGPDL